MNTNMNIYENPDMPTNYGYEYLQPPVTSQPNYQQNQQGAYWNGQTVVNPFTPSNGAPIDSRRNMIQPQSQFTGMQPNGIQPFAPNQMQPTMTNSMYGQLPNQSQPIFYGNGVGTYGVEGQNKQTQTMPGFNQLAESRRSFAQQPVSQPQFAQQFQTNSFEQTAGSQPQQSFMPLMAPSQQSVPNWGPMNPYTQPQTPTTPTVNFQTQQPVPQYNMQPQPQFPSVQPSWMELFRANWNY